MEKSDNNLKGVLHYFFDESVIKKWTVKDITGVYVDVTAIKGGRS